MELCIRDYVLMFRLFSQTGPYQDLQRGRGAGGGHAEYITAYTIENTKTQQKKFHKYFSILEIQWLYNERLSL